MNEVEKMYENAEIEQRCNIYSTFYDCAKYPHEKCEDCIEWEYPPFTAEKQLRLTTFIGLHYGFQMLKNEAFDYIIATKIFVKYELEYQGYGYGYDEAIANLVNNLWQDLTEEERKQIKNILESEVRE
jgi:hypothetical protein